MTDLSKLKTTHGLDVHGKRVLLRGDLNVPVKDGAVTDATRLERLAPTILDLTERGARVIVISHFGRPKVDERDPKLSLKPVAAKLAAILGKPVAFVENCVGEEPERVAATLAPGGVAVLENLRFHVGEENNDEDFAAALARLGDLYVNDAFSAAHRAHASIEALARLLPAYAGPLMMEEIRALRSVLDAPERPMAAVIGGAKVSSKLPILKHLVAKVDKLIIGGGMANTFLLAGGVDIGRSLAEPDLVDTVHEIMHAAKANGCAVVLPADVVVAKEFKEGSPFAVTPVLETPSDGMILDIGPKAIAHMSEVLAECKTILWNGPMGAFEIEPFGEGTFQLAREAARLTQSGALVSVAGGGDTVAALNAAGVTSDFTYVSTAGGAFLEWLEGRELPGVAALAD